MAGRVRAAGAGKGVAAQVRVIAQLECGAGEGEGGQVRGEGEGGQVRRMEARDGMRRRRGVWVASPVRLAQVRV